MDPKNPEKDPAGLLESEILKEEAITTEEEVEKTEEEASGWGEYEAEREEQERGQLEKEYAFKEARAIVAEKKQQEEEKKAKEIQTDLQTLKKNPEKILGKGLMRKMDFSTAYIWVAATVCIDGAALLVDIFSLGFLAMLTPIAQWLTLFLIQRSFKKRGNREVLKMNWKVAKQYIKQATPIVPFLTVYFLKTRHVHNKEAEGDENLIKQKRKELENKLKEVLKDYTRATNEYEEIKQEINNIQNQIEVLEQRKEISNQLAETGREYEKTKEGYIQEFKSKSPRAKIDSKILQVASKYEQAADTYKSTLMKKNALETIAEKQEKKRATE